MQRKIMIVKYTKHVIIFLIYYFYLAQTYNGYLHQ